MLFGFPLDTMLFLWIIPLAIAVWQVIYAYTSKSEQD